MEELMETFTKRGATDLAATIEAYWHKKGFHRVATHLELIQDAQNKLPKYKYYGIRSNLIGGLPPEVYKLRGSVKV